MYMKQANKLFYMQKETTFKTFLDIDYRPVLWGLTDKGEGENRFVKSDEVSKHIQSILSDFDLVVGTEEEVHIAGGSTDTIQALKKIRSLTNALIVLKLGALGATYFSNDIPDSLKDAPVIKGVTVDVLNVLGAGDGFMSGFLKGYLTNKSIEESLTYANACGALVVSRHGCTPAMPTQEELTYYLKNAQSIARPDLHPMLNYLHRVTLTKEKDPKDLHIFAFDHRIQLEEMLNDFSIKDKSIISVLKKLLLKVAVKSSKKANLNPNEWGIFVDDKYGQDVLNEVTGQNLWIGRPVEKPLVFPAEFEQSDFIGCHINTWPKEHIIKFLVFYDSKASEEIKKHNNEKIQNIWKIAQKTNHKLLLEIIPPKEIKGKENREESVYQSLVTIYDELQVFPDWWKLPAFSSKMWDKIESLIRNRSKYCNGVLTLGLDKDIELLKEEFQQARNKKICRGFAIGRSIFKHSASKFLSNQIDEETFVKECTDNYLEIINAWKKSRN